MLCNLRVILRKNCLPLKNEYEEAAKSGKAAVALAEEEATRLIKKAKEQVVETIERNDAAAEEYRALSKKEALDEIKKDVVIAAVALAEEKLHEKLPQSKRAELDLERLWH